jgi:hypothetical protein
MNWDKVKNILIIILVLLNGFLFISMQESGAKRETDAKINEYVFTVLEERFTYSSKWNISTLLQSTSCFTNSLRVSNWDAPVDKTILALPFSLMALFNNSAVCFAAFLPNSCGFLEITIFIRFAPFSFLRIKPFSVPLLLMHHFIIFFSGHGGFLR